MSREATKIIKKKPPTNRNGRRMRAGRDEVAKRARAALLGKRGRDERPSGPRLANSCVTSENY